MLGKFLLIDNYLNETRMALVKDSILEDFDDELSIRKLKKGNIYIGRIMRIEPSLQAAFVDFGFEKHGFLAFSEIRPPDALLRPQAQALKAPEQEVEESSSVSSSSVPLPVPLPLPGDMPADTHEGEEEERPQRPSTSSYKIHDLIKRQQLLLVQVIKDERGNKGAALTTYISLPGRYGFLLPNTLKASGISKKITDTQEREALKTILTALEIPESMSFILRSASMGRKRSEIKRDYDFLMKTWEKIQSHDRESVGLVYGEQDLLIRSLRDLYAQDVQEVIIQGEEAFKRARSYIRAVFPSHSKKISLHAEPVGLFQKFKIEGQIEAIYEHTVTLPSGGSIVINPTEALVSIDVNSSKSTQERNIEDTALKTNLEATIAIARNLKLRDLAGLIVIDFIDLHPNKRPLVEKALKDALALDRARLKIGKISEFGLLEMSRQRLRQSLMESNTHLCTTCHGAGRLLSLPLQSMRALRSLEHVASLSKGDQKITAQGSPEIIVSLLNDHRQFLCDIEKKYGTTLEITMTNACPSGSFLITHPLLAKEVVEKENSMASHKRRRHRSKPMGSEVPSPSLPSLSETASSERETPQDPVPTPPQGQSKIQESPKSPFKGKDRERAKGNRTTPQVSPALEVLCGSMVLLPALATPSKVSPHGVRGAMKHAHRGPKSPHHAPHGAPKPAEKNISLVRALAHNNGEESLGEETLKNLLPSMEIPSNALGVEMPPLKESRRSRLRKKRLGQMQSVSPLSSSPAPSPREEEVPSGCPLSPSEKPHALKGKKPGKFKDSNWKNRGEAMDGGEKIPEGKVKVLGKKSQTKGAKNTPPLDPSLEMSQSLVKPLEKGGTLGQGLGEQNPLAVMHKTPPQGRNIPLLVQDATVPTHKKHGNTQPGEPHHSETKLEEKGEKKRKNPRKSQNPPLLHPPHGKHEKETLRHTDAPQEPRERTSLTAATDKGKARGTKAPTSKERELKAVSAAEKAREMKAGPAADKAREMKAGPGAEKAREMKAGPGADKAKLKAESPSVPLSRSQDILPSKPLNPKKPPKEKGTTSGDIVLLPALGIPPRGL